MKNIKEVLTDAALVTAGVAGERFVEKWIDLAAGKMAPSLAQHKHYGLMKGGAATAVGLALAVYSGKIAKGKTAESLSKVGIGIAAGGASTIIKSKTGALSGLGYTANNYFSSNVVSRALPQISSPRIYPGDAVLQPSGVVNGVEIMY